MKRPRFKPLEFVNAKGWKEIGVVICKEPFGSNLYSVQFPQGECLCRESHLQLAWPKRKKYERTKQ